MIINLNFLRNKLIANQFMNRKVKTSYGELVFTGISETGFMVSFYNSGTSEYQVFEVPEFTVKVPENFNMYLVKKRKNLWY